MIIVRQLPGLRVINSGSPSSYTLVTRNFSETEKLSAPASMYHTASARVFCLHRRSASLLNSHTRTRARFFTRTARVHRRVPTFSCSSSSTHQTAVVSPLCRRRLLQTSITRTRARLFTRTARVHRRAPTFSCSSSSTHQTAGVSPLCVCVQLHTHTGTRTDNSSSIGRSPRCTAEAPTSKPQLSSRVLWTHVIIYCKYKEVKNNGNSCEISKDFLHILHLHVSPHKRAKA